MIKQNKSYKIALVGYQLNNGGLEKVMSNLSVYFGKTGIEVHNILFVDDIAYPYSGVLVNIGKMKVVNAGFLGKLKLFLFFKKYIRQNQFDYIIDFRYRVKPFQEYILSKFVYNSRTIYTIHNSRIQTYLPNSRFLTKLICKGKYSVVSVSSGIKQLVDEKFHLQNSVLIYNPIDLNQIKVAATEEIEIKSPYIVAAGRFKSNNVKQFGELIIAYSHSVLPQKHISLVLLGDGELRDFLKTIAVKYGVQDSVLFLGFKSNPYKYFKNALFLVLCSKHEGFPLALIEALACETPVVSFDCISGPKEIIVDRENGILVENQNFERLTDAINLFVEDEKLYKHCKSNALQSVSKFSVEKIGKQWFDLMKIDINS